MKPNEDFLDYITRCTDLYSKSRLTLPENQYVDMIVANIDAMMRGWLTLKCCLNFAHLRDEGPRVQELARTGILQPNSVENTPTPLASALKFKKNNTNKMAIFEGTTREVNNVNQNQAKGNNQNQN